MQVQKCSYIAGALFLTSLFFFVSLAQASFAAEQKDSKILARVDEAVITEVEFNREIASLHRTMVEEKTDSVAAPAIDFPGVMHRLINLRLLALEARAIGLDQQPEFIREIDQYRTQQLKQRVLGEVVRENPVTAEDAEVQELYQQLSREMRMISMLFKLEADAKKAEAEIKKRGLAAVAADLEQSENIQVSLDDGFIPLKELSPYVGQISIDMKIGDVSPIFRASDDFMIFELAAVRPVEDESVLDEALAIVTQRRQNKVKTEFLENLVKQYAKIDEKLLAKVDFSSAGPTMDALKKDARVLVVLTVPGQVVANFTVADLTEAMADKYYHGLEQARKSRDLNREKETILHKRLMSRLLLAEAKRLGIQSSPEFLGQMEDYENRMLFSEMVRNVIGPDVTFSDAEVLEYYKEHLEQYTTPQMVRLSSIPFATEDDAAQAAEMLRQGADYSWINKNAPGQLRTDEANMTRMTNQVVSMTAIPDEVRQAIRNVAPRETAWYEDQSGYIQLVYIDSVIPGKVRSIDEVRVEIEKAVFRRNVGKAVNDYTDKAREHYVVEIYDPELVREQGFWDRVKSFFD